MSKSHKIFWVGFVALGIITIARHAKADEYFCSLDHCYDIITNDWAHGSVGIQSREPTEIDRAQNACDRHVVARDEITAEPEQWDDHWEKCQKISALYKKAHRDLEAERAAKQDTEDLQLVEKLTK